MTGAEPVAAAAARIAPHVRVTPTITLAADEFGGPPGSRLTLKLESLQRAGSFKARGAFNRLLCGGVPAAGVVAASGGNHGLAVATAARRLGHAAEIFVPAGTPAAKLRRLERLATRVVVTGEAYAEARAAAGLRAAQTGALLVEAYDDERIVVGAGTLAREVEKQAGLPERFVVAVGGGGLAAGCALWLAGRSALVTVETEGCPTLYRALQSGGPVAVGVGGIAVDSLGARSVGAVPWRWLREGVARAVLVSDEAVSAAQRWLWERLRVAAEAGGAAALAALLNGTLRVQRGEHVAVVVCGGNVDPASLSADAEPA